MHSEVIHAGAHADPARLPASSPANPPPSWQDSFRRAYSPQLLGGELLALRRGLAEDDPRLTQAGDVIGVAGGLPPLGASPVAYAVWVAAGDLTAAQLADRLAFMRERAGGHWDTDPEEFDQWWAETPRQIARELLLREVGRELDRRRRLDP